MKENIHPACFETEIKCACGNVVKIKSTKKDLRSDVCSKCHPFYTGKQRFIGADGRVDRFKKRVSATQAVQAKA